MLLFIVLFLISLTFFFPFNQAAEKGVNTLINSYKIPVYYKKLRVGLFSAVVEEAEVHLNDAVFNLGDIHLAYSPLSLINYKASASMENGFLAVSAQNTKKAVNTIAEVNVGRIAKIAGHSATGDLKINLIYEYASKSGSWDASTGRFAFQTPFMQITGNNLKASGIISNNNLIVQNFSSEGDFPITLEGQIRLDLSNIALSRLNLSGEVVLAGSPTPFSLQGALSSPKFSLK
jgi:hypothetical protein